MGIPAFYNWVKERYPLSIVKIDDQKRRFVDRFFRTHFDPTRPNRNGDFDNLYLDMNGIIHPCFHPVGLPAPETYDEVFKAIFMYIDRIFAIVRPRKLLFLAIDGVAPRAKMNHQRSRRFRAARDLLTPRQKRACLSAEAQAALFEQSVKMDSNVITPGTEFMELLSSALRYYVHLRMNKDIEWQGIKVILSDASVPGEGEHKIMSYIRSQRNLPGFDPNTRHCLYGLDADLIMLALSTHEIHFTILREEVRRVGSDQRSKRFKKRMMKDLKKKGINAKSFQYYIWSLKFRFLKIWVLREYLEHEMRIPDTTMTVDLERLIDDFVLMCLFVGNDFLPHIPSLEISEGGIDLLMKVYKEEFVKMGGYLTNSFEVNLERLEHFLQAVGSHECAIFRKCSKKKRKRTTWVRIFANFTLDCSAMKCAEPSMKSGCFGSSLEPLMEPFSQDPGNEQGEVSWKKRYYSEKFEAKFEDDCKIIQQHAVLKYLEGICWIMHYYYEGVCSWQWFYPYHYAPFASDFNGVHHFKIQFTLGEPFKPLTQLMGVLPAASAHALPLSYRKLMTDKSSPLHKFYPTRFQTDCDGKRHSWQGICKLPFIEESLLLSEIAKVEDTLTDEEKRRNSLGLDVLFFHTSLPLAGKILSFCEQMDPDLVKVKVEWKIDAQFSGGMNGYIYVSDKPALAVEICPPIEGMKTIPKNEVIWVFYKYPSFLSHIPRLPKGVKMPQKSIETCDVQSPPALWHEEKAESEQKFSESHDVSLEAKSKGKQKSREIKRSDNSALDNNLGTLASGTLREQSQVSGDHAGAAVKFQETKTEAKTQKWKQSDADGDPNYNVDRLDGCIVRERAEGDKANGYVGLDGQEEIKTEAKPSESLRRSKKRKQILGYTSANIHVEKMENSLLEQSVSDVNNGDAAHLVEMKTVVEHAGVMTLEETQPEGKAGRKGRRCKRRKRTSVYNVANGNVEKLDSCSLVEQSEGNVKDLNTERSEGMKTEESFRSEVVPASNIILGKPNNFVGRQQSKDHQGMGELRGVEEVASCLLSEQSEAVEEHAGVVSLKETQPEAKLGRKKRRCKRKKRTSTDGIANGNIEQSDIWKLSEGDMKQAGAEELDGVKTEVQFRSEAGPAPDNIVGILDNFVVGQQSDNHQGTGGVKEVKKVASYIPSGPREAVEEHTGVMSLKETQPEAKPGRKRRRCKKKKRTSTDGISNGKQSESWKQIEGDMKQDGAERLDRVKAEVRSISEAGPAPNNIFAKLDNFVVRQKSEGHQGIGELKEVEVGSCLLSEQSEAVEEHAGVVSLKETQPEARPGRKKRKCKKRKKTSADGIADGNIEQSERQSEGNMKKSGAVGLDRVKIEVPSRREADPAPNNIVGKLGSFVVRGQNENHQGIGGLKEVEKVANCLLSKHNEAVEVNTGVMSLKETQPETKRGRKKRRCEKRKMTSPDGITNGNSEQLEICPIRKQSEVHMKQADAEGLESTEVEVRPISEVYTASDNIVGKRGSFVGGAQSGAVKDSADEDGVQQVERAANGLLSEQNEAFGDLTVVDGWKEKVKSSGRKRKSRKRKRTSIDGVANENAERTEICILGEQSEGDLKHAEGLEKHKTEVPLDRQGDIV